jgi:PAS domain S-box-containing protein
VGHGPLLLSRLSLRARLLVLVLSALIPMLGLILYVAREQRQSAVETVRATSLRTLRLAAAQQEGAIDGARSLLGGLASLRAVIQRDGAACGAIFSDVLKRSPLYTNLAAATPEGDVFCSSAPLPGPVNLADRPWFRRVLETRDAAVGGYAVGRVSGKPGLAIVYPALDDAGALKGVVYVGLDLARLNQLAARAELPPGSVLLLLDPDGVILTRHPDPEQWVGKAVAETPLGKTVLIQPGEGTAEATFLDGVERVFAFAPIAGNAETGRVRLIVGIPRDVAFAPANRALARNVAALAFIALMVFAFVWVVGDRLVRRPFSVLARATRRLGAGDLTARSGLAAAGGEVGQLARAFDEMAGGLQERERRLGEAERMAAEARFAWILDGSAEAIIAVDETQRIVLFNRGAEAIFGYSAVETLGRPLDLLLPAWAVEAHGRHVRSFAEGPVAARWMGERGEVAGRRKDGTEFPAEASISRQTRNGQTLFTAILRDITERKATQEALRNITEGVAGATGETFFRLLVRHLAHAVGTDYAFVAEQLETESERVATLAVWARGEILGNFEHDLRGGPCEGMARKTLCSHPRGVRQEFPSYRLLAEWDIEAFMGVPLFDSAGKVLGLLVVMHRAPLRDERLTESLLRTFALRAGAEIERARAEKALRESERSLEAVVETAPTLIVVTDPDGRIVLFNRACEELTGYDRREVLGRTIPGLLLPDVRGSHEHPWPTKSGEERLIEWRCMAIPSPKDGRPMILGIGADITEQRRAEEQLRQSQRLEAVGRLAGGIAHDFNNLLTVITGRTQILLSRLRSADPATRDLELISRTAERAGGLTKQLLAFSRRQILQPQVLDLNAVVENTSAMLHRLIGEDIELVFHPGADLGRVKADPGQIEQVFVNLAVNARDAMPRGGRLTIETANVELDETYARARVGVQPGRYVMLGVSDTGAGIAPEVLPRIFEPFFTTKEAGKGTGLGLATVYGIVKQSGGNIWVYSEPGHGTTFKVYLPRVEEAATLPGASKPAAEPRGGTETILLVEDDDDLRSLAREVLEERGYTVLEAAHPGEAPPIAERHAGPIHLLLTDVVMPGMSGRELARRLAEARPEMKVLYISGYTDNAVVHHGVLDPGTPFLEKPFSPDALARKVREVLDTA